ncbi:TPA: hypothetical protein QDB04_000164 [Burkholderia vietnamiensis]|nr:hypothetical protein [Burkholderia vietnamiensis]
MKQRFISEAEFESTYKPVQNPLRKHASWGGCMFETYGPELLHVLDTMKTRPNCVWTVVACDGAITVTSGYYLVNRMGYLITEIPVADDEMVETIDEDAPSSEEDEDDDE